MTNDDVKIWGLNSYQWENIFLWVVMNLTILTLFVMR